MFILTHTEVTNTTSTAYTTLDYGQRHKNKCTGQVLVPRKCGETKKTTRCVQYRLTWSTQEILILTQTEVTW